MSPSTEKTMFHIWFPSILFDIHLQYVISFVDELYFHRKVIAESVDYKMKPFCTVPIIARLTCSLILKLAYQCTIVIYCMLLFLACKQCYKDILCYVHLVYFFTCLNKFSVFLCIL